MWYAIYQNTTGDLVSLGTVIANPLPEGMASVEVGESQPIGEWNPATHAFEAPPTPPKVWLPQDFMQRFTIAEESAIRAKAMTDPTMQTFLARVGRVQVVTENHADLVAGMAYCVETGCLTSERAEEIHHG